MSQPIRYGLADEHLGRVHPKEDGHLVMHSDYAGLADEVERLRQKIEAMRVAGDALETRRYIVDRCKRSTESEEWERAKRGLPSAWQQRDMEKIARLDSWNDSLIAENSRLKAELERLKKAGDAFLGVYIHACSKGLVDEDTAHDVVGEWRDAKEGRRPL